MSLIGLVMYGVIAWVPTFFARTYGMEVSQAGLWFGVIMAIGGAAGLVMGGTLADRMFGKGVADAHLRVMCLSILLGGPPLLAAMLIDRKSVVEGKSVSVRVDLGGGRIIKK